MLRAVLAVSEGEQPLAGVQRCVAGFGEANRMRRTEPHFLQLRTPVLVQFSSKPVAEHPGCRPVAADLEVQSAAVAGIAGFFCPPDRIDLDGREFACQRHPGILPLRIPTTTSTHTLEPNIGEGWRRVKNRKARIYAALQVPAKDDEWLLSGSLLLLVEPTEGERAGAQSAARRVM